MFENGQIAVSLSISNSSEISKSHCTVGQTAAIIESYNFVWSYKGSETDSKNVEKLVVSFFTVLKKSISKVHILLLYTLPENG